jgi:hypothetical protein
MDEAKFVKELLINAEKLFTNVAFSLLRGQP